MGLLPGDDVLKSAGRFICRVSSCPVDGAGGDVTAGHVLNGDARGVAPGSYVLMVADVTGNGPAAAELVKQSGLVALFQSSLRRQLRRGKGLCIKRLMATIDRRLAGLLPKEIAAQITLALATPAVESVPGEVRFCPDNALVFQRSEQNGDWKLGMTGFLAGMGLPIPPTSASVPFHQSSEFGVFTDGLPEQTVAGGGRFGDQIDLTNYSFKAPLHGQIQNAWRDAVDAHGEQGGDELLVTLRQATEEEALVLRVLEGDEAAATEFVRRRFPWMMNLVRALAAAYGIEISRDQRRELAQDATAHLLLKLRRWKGGNLIAFLKVTAINYLITGLRKLPPPSPPTVPDDPPDRPGGVSGPEAALLAEKQEQFMRWFTRLPDKMRLFLRLIRDGLSPQEVAKQIGRDRKTFFNLQKKLLAALFKALDLPWLRACDERPGEMLAACLRLFWLPEGERATRDPLG